MANRLSKRRRERLAKRREKIAAIVAANLSGPMPERSSGSLGSIVNPDRLKSSTHLGVRGGSTVKVIGHQGFRLGRPEPTPFGKVPLPPGTPRATAPKSKPFAKDGYDDGTRQPGEQRASRAPWSKPRP